SIRAAPLATIANGWATPAAVQSAPANQERFFALGCAQRSHAPVSASEPTQQAENASTLEFPSNGLLGVGSVVFELPSQPAAHGLAAQLFFGPNTIAMSGAEARAFVAEILGQIFNPDGRVPPTERRRLSRPPSASSIVALGRSGFGRLPF